MISEQGRVSWWPAWALALAFLLVAVGSWEVLMRSAALGPEYLTAGLPLYLAVR